MDIVKEKIKQTTGVLDEMDIDLWLMFVRETSMQADPMFPLMVGLDAVWPSFFAFTRKGDAVALIGNYDEEDYIRSGRFTEVIPYTEGVGADIKKLLKRLNPNSIALDYSLDDAGADGLTHGMYLQLCRYLEDTPFRDRLVSAEAICSKVRARKTVSEIDRLTRAAEIACDVWDKLVDEFTPGMSEIEVADRIENEIRSRGGVISFETAANAGAKSKPGHGSPTDAKIEPGDLLHVDFGVRIDDYCSDIQRLLYFRRRGETGVPEELTEAFGTVRDIISKAGLRCQPGIKGYEVDAEARSYLKDHGYEEYQHALGHQLGRAVHDGGALIGPKWERYGKSPEIPLEENNVFTLELGIELAGIGYVGLEEDMVVEANGARFLSRRQNELDVK